MNERIDFFGKYSKKMSRIHTDFFNRISFPSNIDTKVIERTLLQCNYSEYIEHHPEETAYHWDLYNFTFGKHTAKIATAFNIHFFKKKKDHSHIVESLINTWEKHTDCSIFFSGNGNNIDDLQFHPYDMMQTAHFIYKKQELFGSGIDLQLFKIVYPYKTLEPLLQSWDKYV